MKIYQILLLIVILASCETIIDVDLPEEAPRLVANAIINPDSLIKVHISQSQYILDNAQLKGINNAHVSIFEEGIFKEQLFKSQTDGMYVSQLAPQVGKAYTLKAEAPNFTPIEATTTLLPKVPIQHITIDSTYEQTGGICMDGCDPLLNYQFDLTLQDPANVPNYYSVLAYAKQIITYTDFHPDGSFEEKSEEIIVYLYLNSEDISLALSEFDIEGSSFRGRELYFSDEIFDGQTYTFKFETDNSFSSSSDIQEFSIILKHLTEAQFQYEVTKELQSWNEGNPFAEPVPVYNNIENGYGIFAGFSADTKTMKP